MYMQYPRNCPDFTVSYIIKPGDTLYNISLQYNVTVKEILKINPFLNPYNLLVGQKICIPLDEKFCPNGQVYTVKLEDTYLKIALKFDISYMELANSNNELDPYNIKPGQKLCIPYKMPDFQCPTGNSYVIKKDETLSTISEQFNVSATDVLLYNPKMSPSDFEEGVEICIPPETEV